MEEPKVEESTGQVVESVKKKRGNPAFQKGKPNTYYKPDNKDTMSETVNPVEKPIEKPVEKKEPSSDTTKGSNPLAEEVKKEIPDDLFSDAIPASVLMPLDGEVEEKAYGQIKEPLKVQPTNGAQTSSTTPPPIQPPVGDPTQNMGGEPLGQPTTTPPVVAPTPEEVNSQAKQTVDALLKLYEKMHGVGRWVTKVNPEVLMQHHMQGKIDLNMELPIGEKKIEVKDFFSQFNQSIDESICVDQEFKDNITPPLVRIAIKRGWLLSDEIYVGMLLAEDLATKVSIAVGLKKSANMVLEACMDMKKNLEKYGSVVAPTPKERKPREKNEATDESNHTDVTPPENMGPDINENDMWREPETTSNG